MPIKLPDARSYCYCCYSFCCCRWQHSSTDVADIVGALPPPAIVVVAVVAVDAALKCAPTHINHVRESLQLRVCVCVCLGVLVNGKSADAVAGFSSPSACVFECVCVDVCMCCVLTAYRLLHIRLDTGSSFIIIVVRCFCYCCFWCCCWCCASSCCCCLCTHVSMTAEDTFSVSCLIRLPRRCAHSQRQLAPLFMALKLRLSLTSILKVLYPGERHRSGEGVKNRAGRERETQ